VPIKLGSRRFEPRAFTTLVTLGLFVLLVSLGRWQLRRADEKQRLYDAFAAGTDTSTEIVGTTPALPRFRHVDAAGHYDPARQVLIDNMADSDGRAGYFVITPFALAGGGWLLVNRGWIPWGASRAERPDLAVGGGARRIHGRIDQLPSPGLRMGRPAPLLPPFPVVATFPTRAELGVLLHENAWASAGDVVLLDAADADGYRRNWLPPGIAPLRHTAYAVQWFALAAALVVIYVLTNLSKPGLPRESLP
jgi:surfeit locus 1 family protein